jgi:hypothetical protein
MGHFHSIMKERGRIMKIERDKGREIEREN